MQKKQTIIEIVTDLLVLLFVYAAISKLIPYRISYMQLSISPYIREYAGIIVWAVPVSELLLCILLLIPRWRQVGFIGSFIILAIFTFYIIAVLNWSTKIPCNCGGVISLMSWNQHMIFNAFFMTIAAVGFVLNRKVLNQPYYPDLQNI